MITTLVPLGPITFTPAQTAIIITFLLLGAIAVCLPVSLPMGLYGAAAARRAGQRSFWPGVSWWFGGTVLTLLSMWAASALGLNGVPVVLLGWLPGAVILVLVHRRRREAAPAVESLSATGAAHYYQPVSRRARRFPDRRPPAPRA